MSAQSFLKIEQFEPSKFVKICLIFHFSCFFCRNPFFKHENMSYQRFLHQYTDMKILKGGGMIKITRIGSITTRQHNKTTESSIKSSPEIFRRINKPNMVNYESIMMYSCTISSLLEHVFKLLRVAIRCASI